MQKHEKSRYLTIAGMDESGAGNVAGSLFCASVILPNDYYNKSINDSKKLSRKKINELYKDISSNCITYQVEEVTPQKIDEINILQARFYGWNQCIKNMNMGAELLLIDGNRFYNEYHIPFELVVKGDSKYLDIACASILAKYYKELQMEELHEKYPMYNWIKNSGYATKQHKDAIREYGLTEYHRKSYNIKL